MNYTKALKYWSVHAIFCATPSFLIAYGSGYNSFASVAGMLLAIVAFIGIYAGVSSSHHYRTKADRYSFGRIVHIAASVRSFVSALGLIGLLSTVLHHSRIELRDDAGLAFLYLPDMLAGMIAVAFSSSLFGFLGVRGVPSSTNSIESVGSFFLGNERALIPTFVTTFCEGVILSGTLLFLVLLVFVCVRLVRWIRAVVA